MSNRNYNRNKKNHSSFNSGNSRPVPPNPKMHKRSPGSPNYSEYQLESILGSKGPKAPPVADRSVSPSHLSLYSYQDPFPSRANQMNRNPETRTVFSDADSKNTIPGFLADKIDEAQITVVQAARLENQSRKVNFITGLMLVFFAVLATIVAVSLFLTADDNDEDDIVELNGQQAALICLGIEFNAALGASFCADENTYVRCDDEGVDFNGVELLRECEETCGCPINEVVTGGSPCTEDANICIPADERDDIFDDPNLPSEAEAIELCTSVAFDLEVKQSFCASEYLFVKCDDDGVDFDGDNLFGLCETGCACDINLLVEDSNPCNEANDHFASIGDCSFDVIDAAITDLETPQALPS
eukprot:snap_masked-scaffold_7-processed-gene-12.24-mRNA-1 protein AED:1.00 eAED:1.00 QI:0/0/0/0/1/1/2/0/357